jgi:CDP-paratose 2-epimerase
MPTAIVTGSGGLVGSAAARHFAAAGYDVIGIENDMRARLFPAASTSHVTRQLTDELDTFHHVDVDVRDRARVEDLFARHGPATALVIHAAAQPSHDWAASDPHADFTINANATLNLLQAARDHAPDATFVFTSTNKVYGDLPNQLPLQELESRLELPESHRWHDGIDTSMSIDRSTHSLFGVSKTAADLMVQEYGRYFGMPTACFRCGCLTGPQHMGAEQHGFLAYLMKCVATATPYTVFGHGGKQVRDSLHCDDAVRAFAAFHADPRPGAVYNLGGGRASNCSVLEAIALSEEIAGKSLAWELSDEARIGDHRWWVSDLRAFRADYPSWSPTYDVPELLREMHDVNAERWSSARP